MESILVIAICGALAVMATYMAPSIIAFRKGHPYRWALLVANILSGWTGIAWFPLLIWSFRPTGFPLLPMRR